MEVDRKSVLNASRESGFQPDIIEKALRLTHLLREINNHYVLERELVLKGGTAINFVYLPLPRLSVDLDFNFVGSLDKEETSLKRKNITKYLKIIFSFFKYQVREREEYGQNRFFLSYRNSASNTDIIKLEVNYLSRVSLLISERRKISLPFLKIDGCFANSMAFEELYGEKIKALMTRKAARDLFDVYSLLNMDIKFKEHLLRKIVIFFGCLERDDFRECAPDAIENITDEDIKNNLLPLLRKRECPHRSKMIKTVKPFLIRLLTLSGQEKKYMEAFFKGKYLPSLLFADDEINDINSLQNHPMALWKQKHLTEWLKNN